MFFILCLHICSRLHTREDQQETSHATVMCEWDDIHVDGWSHAPLLECDKIFGHFWTANIRIPTTTRAWTAFPYLNILVQNRISHTILLIKYCPLTNHYICHREWLQSRLNTLNCVTSLSLLFYNLTRWRTCVAHFILKKRSCFSEHIARQCWGLYMPCFIHVCTWWNDPLSSHLHLIIYPCMG